VRVVLASASPRRHELLRAAGLAFEVEVAGVDETLAGDETAEHAATLLAERKALAIAAQHSGEETLILGADTVVAATVDGCERLLGKPSDEGEARTMLEALSGSRHRVVTGVAVVRARDGALRSAHERTWVSMRPIRPDEVAAYVASGEWRDKAGGYAIQENADVFVTRLEEGGFDNVVGLPVGMALRLLQELG
jgi:septum formation protein